MKSFWNVVGIALLAWVAWDLYAGYTLTWEFIYRESQPKMYWTIVGMWTLLALSCFVPWNWRST